MIPSEYSGLNLLNINEYYNKRTNQIIVDDFEIDIVTNSFDDLM